MPEQVGILLVFLVVVLFNVIRAYLSHRRQREAARKAERDAQRPPAPARVPPRAARTPQRPEVSAPVPRRPPPALRRPRPRLDLRRGDLRRAVVLMTVLGPPRALEHESREVSGAR